MRTSNLPLPAWPLHALKKACPRIKLLNQQLHLRKLQEQRPASTRISPATLRLHGMQFNNWHRFTPRNGQSANRTERAAKRIQRAIRKKQVHAQPSPQASAFRLDPWKRLSCMPQAFISRMYRIPLEITLLCGRGYIVTPCAWCS